MSDIMKPSDYVSHRSHLGPEFASRLLEAELELENNCCLTVLQELLDLYQEAVEIYERNDDLRYLDFQKRIHSVLVKPEVQAVLNAPPGPPRQEQSKTEKLKDKKAKLDQFKRNKTVQLPTTDPEPLLPAQEHVIVAAREFTDMTMKTSETIQKTMEGVKQQVSQLEQRRLARRNKMKSIDWSSQSAAFNETPAEEISPEKPRKINSGNSSRRNSITPNSLECIKAAAVESDKSGGHIRLPATIEDFQQKLEDLMEQAFSEKAAKLAEVKMRYEAEMKKAVVEAGDATLAEMLVTHIRKLMEDELKSTSSECDTKRKQSIAALKAELV